MKYFWNYFSSQCLALLGHIFHLKCWNQYAKMDDGQVRHYSFSTVVAVAPDSQKNHSRRLPWLHLTDLWCSVCRAGVFGVLPWVCLGQSSLFMERFRNWRSSLDWGCWWHHTLKRGCLFPAVSEHCRVWVKADGAELSLLSQAAVCWGEHVCRGAGDHYSGDEGWAARPVLLLSLPGDLFTCNAGKCWMWYKVSLLLKFERKRNNRLVCRNACQRVITPYIACLPPPFLFWVPKHLFHHRRDIFLQSNQSAEKLRELYKVILVIKHTAEPKFLVLGWRYLSSAPCHLDGGKHPAGITFHNFWGRHPQKIGTSATGADWSMRTHFPKSSTPCRVWVTSRVLKCWQWRSALPGLLQLLPAAMYRENRMPKVFPICLFLW